MTGSGPVLPHLRHSGRPRQPDEELAAAPGDTIAGVLSYLGLDVER